VVPIILTPTQLLRKVNSSQRNRRQAVVKLLLEEGTEKIATNLTWLKIIKSFYYNTFDREGPGGADIYILWNVATGWIQHVPKTSAKRLQLSALRVIVT
jgi:hypothetical protein